MSSQKLLSRRACSALLLGGALSLPLSFRAESQASIVVYKGPRCDCCGFWTQHLKSAGFSVEVFEIVDLVPIKQRLGVPLDLASCHTCEMGGYAVEGHVPAAALTRLLTERPEGRGIAVPGMPRGSPGMEGGAPVVYEVILFGPNGRKIFARYRGTSEA